MNDSKIKKTLVFKYNYLDINEKYGDDTKGL